MSQNRGGDGQAIATVPSRFAAAVERFGDAIAIVDGERSLSYRTLDGIHAALFHLSKRLSRQPHLETATRHLVDSREELERLFGVFFPEVAVFSGR